MMRRRCVLSSRRNRCHGQTRKPSWKSASRGQTWSWRYMISRSRRRRGRSARYVLRADVHRTSPFNSDGRRSSTSMAITIASVYSTVPALLLMAPWHVPPGLPGLVSKQLRHLPHIGPSSHWPSRWTETLVAQQGHQIRPRFANALPPSWHLLPEYKLLRMIDAGRAACERVAK
jgi:hypothetical protein